MYRFHWGLIARLTVEGNKLSLRSRSTFRARRSQTSVARFRGNKFDVRELPRSELPFPAEEVLSFAVASAGLAVKEVANRVSDCQLKSPQTSSRVKIKINLWKRRKLTADVNKL